MCECHWPYTIIGWKVVHVSTYAPILNLDTSPFDSLTWFCYWDEIPVFWGKVDLSWKARGRATSVCSWCVTRFLVWKNPFSFLDLCSPLAILHYDRTLRFVTTSVVGDPARESCGQCVMRRAMRLSVSHIGAHHMHTKFEHLWCLQEEFQLCCSYFLLDYYLGSFLIEIPVLDWI